MVSTISKKSLHCPQCGQSFHAEDVIGKHAVHDFICSVCSFEFQLKYDQHLKIYRPLVDLAVISPLVSDFNPSLQNLPKEKASTFFVPDSKSKKSSPLASKRQGEGTSGGDVYDPIAARLKQKWQEVLEDFNTSELHSQFIDLCHQLGRLEFAKERYDYLKQALGEDPEVTKRIRQIEMKLLQIQEVMARITYEDQILPYWRRIGTLFLVAVLLALTGTLLPSLRWVSFLGFFILAGLLFNSIKK